MIGMRLRLSAAAAGSLARLAAPNAVEYSACSCVSGAADAWGRRGISSRPKSAIPVDTKKTHETAVVRDCGSSWMRWVGRGSVTQMYCALLLSGTLVFQADASANMYEVVAMSGAISSASASVYFAAKMLCDKVVTDVVSYRKVGEKDEFVKVSVLGAMSKQDFHGVPSDLTLLEHDGADVYRFQFGGRRLELDTSTGECVNRRALELLLQGKPLVVKKTKQGKKRSRCAD